MIKINNLSFAYGDWQCRLGSQRELGEGTTDLGGPVVIHRTVIAADVNNAHAAMHGYIHEAVPVVSDHPGDDLDSRQLRHRAPT